MIKNCNIFNSFKSVFADEEKSSITCYELTIVSGSVSDALKLILDGGTACQPGVETCNYIEYRKKGNLPENNQFYIT